MNTIYGINSKKKSNLFPAKNAFKPFKIIPNIIYRTPNITDIFIFNELLIPKLLGAIPQTGSLYKIKI